MKFVTRGMNLIDLFTILPFYVELALSAFGINAERLKELTGKFQNNFVPYDKGSFLPNYISIQR
jgi:hypothetical protein